MFRIIFSLILVSLSLIKEVRSENVTEFTQSSYGTTGLIEIPSARFSNDGEFGFGISSEVPWNRLYAQMQFLPWVEAVLRYTEGTYLPYNPGSKQTWKDKGIDLKFRLMEEETMGVNLAIGFVDLGGTGAYSSEFLVATKRFNNFDWTIGLGWGKLGGVDHIRNPLSIFDKNREKRGGYKRGGGSISFGRFFSGENMSIFGGVEYFTPVENLSLKLEYDTTDYRRPLGRELVFDEIVGNRFELDSRLNYSLTYRMDVSQRDQLDLSLGFVRGNTLYANVAVHSNLNFSGTPKIRIGAEKIRNTNLPGGDTFLGLDQNRKEFLTNRTIIEMANSGIVTHSITYNGEELSAEISQSVYRDTSKAIDLASRILANNSPRNIKKITISNIDNGIETLRSSIFRDDLVKSVATGPLNDNLLIFNEESNESDDSVTVLNEFLYPNFYWEVKPRLNSTLQHPIQFFFWQLEANIHSVYAFRKGLYLTTEIGIDIDNNFDKYTFHVADGELYHVRQDRRLYLIEGETGLRRMVLDYYFDINQNFKGKLSAGYLEWMYGGIGGEILYMPENRRWGIGIDAHWVKQREFEQKFGFKDYETVLGFLSYYQDIPFYNLRLKASVGRFLAKDIGGMVDISRRFESGARVGAFVALTDCDADCVGEGNFHKGIYFELPMDLFYIQSNTRKKTGYSWSPLTKDVAAKIDTPSLYSIMVDASDEVDSLRQKQWSLGKIFSGFSTGPKKRYN